MLTCIRSDWSDAARLGRCAWWGPLAACALLAVGLALAVVLTVAEQLMEGERGSR